MGMLTVSLAPLQVITPMTTHALQFDNHYSISRFSDVVNPNFCIKVFPYFFDGKGIVNVWQCFGYEMFLFIGAASAFALGQEKNRLSICGKWKSIVDFFHAASRELTFNFCRSFHPSHHIAIIRHSNILSSTI